MSRVKSVNNDYIIYCPACQVLHLITSDFQFNGDYENPTFKSTIRYQFNEANKHQICHIVISNGRIMYLPDSTHILRGVELELLDESRWE